MGLEAFIQRFKEPSFSPEELEEIQTIQEQASKVKLTPKDIKESLAWMGDIKEILQYISPTGYYSKKEGKVLVACLKNYLQREDISPMENKLAQEIMGVIEKGENIKEWREKKIKNEKESLKNGITVLNQNSVFNWKYDSGWLAIPLLEKNQSLFSASAQNKKDKGDHYLLPFPDGTIHKIQRSKKNKFADLGEIDDISYLFYGPLIEEKIEDIRKVIEESPVL
jgi:hypothetical protein